MFKYENDSRKVTKGQTFIAIKGLTVDGHNYIEKAIEKGAEKIICEKDLDINIPYEKVKDTTQYQKEILYKEYGNIIEKLNIIGITGTNGKTTSCYLIYQMLIQLGLDTAYIGTLGFYYKDEHIDLPNTTPDILVLYKLLVKAQEQGCKIIIMEVSSQALSYDRLYGIRFSLIGFTNLTEDHLDYHKTMDNYLNAKLLILDQLTDDAKIIANCDDEKHNSFKKDGHEFITFGNNGDYKIINYITNPSSTDLTFEYNNIEYNVNIPLNSKFNIYNYLTMLSVVNQFGISIEKIIQNSNILKAPKGRCETYKIKNGYAVVDYAHSPDAVLKVISAYNDLKKNRIITIIGCGGDRDPKKRPIMGKIATELSDFVIFTNDNPRTEDPTKIMADILSGVKKENYKVIYDRKEAIKYGLDMLEKDDIILLLGKGHENYQIIGREKIHLDDSEEILNYEK
ncbi:MAG: UDP-N-acetylmuramoyl-L-alanyl-D-glutamate--2,6-diaminopimelate ligase [bacterium]|nr:UDP-N-acetylmuramoyl-L-alanyl-D-glutamate--2,6-diaminopimelate ligase [bacterium]